MPDLIRAYVLRTSPGYQYAQGYIIELDTRYVIGMDVVRFQK